MKLENVNRQKEWLFWQRNGTVNVNILPVLLDWQIQSRYKIGLGHNYAIWHTEDDISGSVLISSNGWSLFLYMPITEGSDAGQKDKYLEKSFLHECGPVVVLQVHHPGQPRLRLLLHLPASFLLPTIYVAANTYNQHYRLIYYKCLQQDAWCVTCLKTIFSYWGKELLFLKKPNIS